MSERANKNGHPKPERVRVASEKQMATKKQKLETHAKFHFEIGTCVRKFFESDGYFNGKVISRRVDEIGPLYKVRYDDGDKEEYDDKELQVLVKEAQDYAQQRISSNSTTPPAIVSPEASSFGASDDDDTSIPSNNEDIVALKLQQNEFASKLKKEEKKLKLGKNISLESLPEAHRVHYEEWIKANTDARTRQGRFVFRRATGPEGKEKQPSIVEVLGGNGMEPWPIVKHARNPQFVADDEFFVAGRSDFNPWGPRFPKDKTGLLNIEAVTQTDQKEFHLFEQCHTSKMSTHYQGANAKGGYFYAGVYRCAQSDIQSITVTLNQDGLDETRWTYAELMVNRKSRQTFYYRHVETRALVPIVPDEVLAEFSGQAEEIHSDEWDRWSEKKKEIAAWEVMLYQRKYDVELVPIVYVRYDQELYDVLVEVGASKGQLSTQHDDLGIF